MRVLHVKGEALHPVLAKGRTPSSDCDVLVHPSGVVPYVAMLREHGWELRTGFERGSVFGHAATLYNPTWGTVDVHRHFPGLDRDGDATFELFWSRRRTRILGGAECQVPDLLCQRLLLLVHAARDGSGRAAHDVRVSWTEATEDERTQIDALADELGGRVPVALATGRQERATGLPHEFLWRAIHRGGSASEVWRARMKDALHAGPGAVLHVAVEAAHINTDHLALRLGRPPTPEDLRKERWDRGRRALRAARGLLPTRGGRRAQQ